MFQSNMEEESCVLCGKAVGGAKVCISVAHSMAAPDGGYTLVMFRLDT